MLESVAFFEPYWAVLLVLQKFTYDNFPMMNYFLGLETVPSTPIYVHKTSTYTLRTSNDQLVNIGNLIDLSLWPSPDQLGLDDRQHAALQAALTSQVSLIQGPPGTGKTFLALRILRSLMDNKSQWYGKWGATKQLLQQLHASNANTWYERNKLFWRKPTNIIRDSRAPVVVICYTVRSGFITCNKSNLSWFLFHSYRITPLISFLRVSYIGLVISSVSDPSQSRQNWKSSISARSNATQSSNKITDRTKIQTMFISTIEWNRYCSSTQLLFNAFKN